MRKFVIFTFILSVFAITINCEVDDICTEKVLTPRLIVTFYDQNDLNDLLSVSNLYVWAEGKDTLYANTTTDSIAIPLNTNFDETKYLFSKNNTVDTLKVKYTRNNVFVSRSCGYKTLFSIQNTTTLTNYWAEGYEIINQQVENENQAHVKIYH